MTAITENIVQICPSETKQNAFNLYKQVSSLHFYLSFQLFQEHQKNGKVRNERIACVILTLNYSPVKMKPKT